MNIAALLTDLREGRVSPAAIGELLAAHPELQARLEAALAAQSAPGGMIFNAPVTVTGGHLGPVINITARDLILCLAPRVEKKIALVYACTQHDVSLVEREVQRLRNDGYQVDFDPASRSGGALSDADSAALAEAEQVHVFWSVEARRDPRVEAEIALVRQIDQDRALGAAAGVLPEGTRASLTGRFVVTRLDRAELPAALALDTELPSFPVLAGGGVVLAGLAWAAHQGWPLGGRLVLAALVGAGLVLLAAAQMMRRGDRVLRAATVHGWGLWLDRATSRDILELSDRTLNRVFGEKILSWRSVAVSGALSIVTVAPLAVLWGWWLGSEQDGTLPTITGFVVGGVTSLSVTLPLACGNVAMDFVALGIGRAILRWSIRRLAGMSLGLGMLGEWLLILAASSAALYSNLMCFIVVTFTGQSMFAWPLSVWATVLSALTGDIAWHNLHRGYYLPAILLTAFAVVTGVFPALLHGTLIALATLNRLLRHRLLPFWGETLQRAADSPHGPWTLGAPCAALLTVVGLVTSAPHPASGLQPAQEDLRPVPLRSLCSTGCTIGNPKSELYWEEDEASRVVKFSKDILMMRVEVSQARWALVWRRAADVEPGRLGLPEAPSVFRGKALPVEGISWCEAARFANLWSLTEGLMPAYRIDSKATRDKPFALSGCEEGIPVIWDHNSTAYRLPTEAEWEVAARGGNRAGRRWTGKDEHELLAAEWLGPNAGWRTHAGCTTPGHNTHPLGLCDMLGNVQEWTWDLYMERPPGGLDPEVSEIAPETPPLRVFRGGSWNFSPAVVRSAQRFWFHTWWRADDHGFRLVRSVPPVTSGSDGP